MTFELPKLGYEFSALEPVIDAKTMEVHYGKHHAAYVEKLNAALEGHDDLMGMSVEKLMAKLDTVPEEIRTAVRNNGGGHANHSLFWKVMSPEGGGEPGGKLAEAIAADLGGVEKFKEEFSNAAGNRFGSGWAWLTVERGKLHVCSTPNQDNPWMEGNTPILGLDVWEHAYYLSYKWQRPEYIKAWWNIVDWEKVGDNYHQVLASS